MNHSNMFIGIAASFLAAFSLSAGSAHAAGEYSRTNGSTGCHSQKDEYFFQWTSDGLVPATRNPVERHSSGLKVVASAGTGETWVRCDVASNSLLSHTQIGRVKVFGHLNNSINEYRLIKLCSVNAYTGYYDCNDEDAEIFNIGGNYARELYPAGEWASPTRFPVVVMRLYEGDTVRGIGFSED